MKARTRGGQKDLQRHLYYMKIAEAVGNGANCFGRSVGSFIVRENRIVSTGYNGTPEGVTNCLDRGCPRCDPQTKEYWGVQAGEYYDVCLCVHAEENALVTAARFGSTVAKGALYTTLQPCFICMRELLQAKIESVYYLETSTHPKEKQLRGLASAYNSLAKRFKVFRQIPPSPTDRTAPTPVARAQTRTPR